MSPTPFFGLKYKSAAVAVFALWIGSGCNHSATKAGGSSTAANSPAMSAVTPPAGDPATKYYSVAAPIASRAETKQSHLKAYQEKVLPNGLHILYVPDTSLPYVHLSLLIRVGAVQDPEGLSGLSSLVAELLDKGTTHRNATEISNELGQMGADFSSSTASEYSVINAGSLSNVADKLVSNVFEIVTEPTFSDSEIERLRKQTTSVIDRMQDNPEAFSENAFARFLYGTHPYARPVLGTLESVATIKKKHIIQHYLRYYRPNNTTLAVVGKFTPELATQVETLFGRWTAREINPILVGQPLPIEGLQIELVNKPGMGQSQIHLGNFGIARKDPDFLALRLANAILGGGFKSRLVDRVRSELGLTYSIRSFFDSHAEPGDFQISTFSKNESVAKTVEETLKVLGAFVDQGVTSDEVERAKGYMKGIFPTAIETPEELAFNLMLLRFYGVGDEYLTGFLSDIDHLKTSEVNAAIRRHMNAKNVRVLVYSTAEQTLPQLRELSQKLGGREVLVKESKELR